MGLGAKLKGWRRARRETRGQRAPWNEPDASAAPGLSKPGTPPTMLSADAAAWGFPPELRPDGDVNRPD